MRVLSPDHDRLIDLPGVGPCPRPVDIDQSVTGFADLVSLRVYEFEEGSAIEGEAEDDEVLVVLLAGAATIAVTGAHEAAFTLQAEGDWAIYLPPRHHYRLEPMAPATVAYARARPQGAASNAPGNAPGPRAFAPVAGVLAIEEPAERLRLRMIPLAGEVDASAGLDGGLERLAHVTGPGRVLAGGTVADLSPMDTMVLPPGASARIDAGETGGGDLLVVAALRPPA